MISYDDLVAARLLNRQLPTARDVLLRALDATGQGGDQRSLLARLAAEQVVSFDQARYVHEAVQRHKRSRLLQVYAHLLATQGVPGPRLQELMERIGPEADASALGNSLVSEGLLPQEQEQRYRFQARVACDRQQAQELQAYLDSRGQAVGVPQGTTISGVIKLPPMGADGSPGVGSLVDSTNLRKVAEEQLAPPQFAVPEWIDTSDPQVGHRIERYRVLGRIGAGAMGIVFLADGQDDPTLPVALKVLNGDATEDAKGRFKREILANGFFSHPGVIDVYDAGRTPEGHDYLAMEFFDGEDLAEILETETQLAPKQALQLCRQVFATLGAAHEAGIIHRDVKPANILISHDGQVAKLMDFGIAIIRDLGEFEGMVFKTVEGGATGTPQFMSPEQAAGDKITPSSDLYSMGMVLYQCLSGRLPFESESANGFMACHMMEDPLPLAKADPSLKSLPKQLHELLDRLFDKNPANRPPDAATVAAELEQIVPLIKDKKKGGGLWGLLWGGKK